MRRLAILASLLIAGCGSISSGQAQKVHGARIDQTLSDYEIARGRGDILDMCVKAKLVAIAYEDAGQGPNAEAWRAREAEACRLAYEAMGGGREAD
jgi:hypothetical protein